MINTIKNDDGFYYVDPFDVLAMKDMQDYEDNAFEEYCKHRDMIDNLRQWSGKPVGDLRKGKPKHRNLNLSVISDDDDLPF